MSKERLNVTVDPDVKRDAQARSDLNVSGAVNEFLRRRLRGEEKDVAVQRMEIERLREEADDKEEEANQLRSKADRLERELEERLREKRKAIEEAIEEISVRELRSMDTPIIDTDQEKVEALADAAGVEPGELKRKAIDRHTDSTDPTYR
jgi:predicted  nucleic acid-binding Zn-ribbon protein